MRKFGFVVLFSGSFLLAQDSGPNKASQDKSKASKDEITVQGCVGRSSGDYVLTKQNPGMTYELQATPIRMRSCQRLVESDVRVTICD